MLTLSLSFYADFTFESAGDSSGSHKPHLVVLDIASQATCLRSEHLENHGSNPENSPFSDGFEPRRTYSPLEVQACDDPGTGWLPEHRRLTYLTVRVLRI